MEGQGVEKLLHEMDGIRIDSGKATETGSVGEIDPEHDTDQQALFEIRLIARKGLGLFATKDIPRGTLIIAESALITALASDPDFESMWIELKRLTPEQHQQLSDLSSVASTVKQGLPTLIRHRLRKVQQYRGVALDAATADELKMRAIFNTNAVAMGADGQHGKGTFFLSSRINHSCVPNVVLHYNATLGKATIYSTREIKEGEELLRSYVPIMHKNTKQRQAALAYWAIDCDCAACEGPQMIAREKRRQRIVELAAGLTKYDKGMLACSIPSNPSKALDWAEEAVRLLKQQGLEDMELAPAYRKCSKYCVQLGQLEKAMAYARKELEVQRYCLGTETEHLESDMEGAEFWIKDLEQRAEHDRVKIAMNQKRTKKEEKRAEKKAMKKAGKGGR